MQQIIESLTDPADHLALDEAALLLAGEGEFGEPGGFGETIRFWELEQPVAVLGRSSKVEFEVDRDFCESNSVPIMRRCSGGATVVAGPGCLMYSVVLSCELHPELRKIDAAHEYVMTRVAKGVCSQNSDVKLKGICDLTLDDKKFSGNALRITRSHVLYHGTILYAADLELLVSCLRNAPRQPKYRKGRDHRDFVTNLTIDPKGFADTLLAAFGVNAVPIHELPRTRIRKLRQERYDAEAWHMRH